MDTLDILQKTAERLEQQTVTHHMVHLVVLLKVLMLLKFQLLVKLITDSNKQLLIQFLQIKTK